MDYRFFGFRRRAASRSAAVTLAHSDLRDTQSMQAARDPSLLLLNGVIVESVCGALVTLMLSLAPDARRPAALDGDLADRLSVCGAVALAAVADIDRCLVGRMAFGARYQSAGDACRRCAGNGHQGRRVAAWLVRADSLAECRCRGQRRQYRPRRIDRATCLSLGIGAGSSPAAAGGDVVLVLNEVSMGILPQGAVSRWFVDESGRLNQTVGAVCERVTLAAAGLPLVLKG